MLRHVEKVIIVVLLGVALVVWRPLLRWHPLFTSSPAVVFNVPVFLPLVFETLKDPSLPPVWLVQVPTLTVVQINTLLAAKLPVFDKGIGPYLVQAEAEQASVQASQLLKTPRFIVQRKTYVDVY